MDTQKIVRDIQDRASAAGLSMYKVCTKAGIMPHTYISWKKGRNAPNLSTLTKIYKALDELEKQTPA